MPPSMLGQDPAKGLIRHSPRANGMTAYHWSGFLRPRSKMLAYQNLRKPSRANGGCFRAYPFHGNHSS